MTACCLILAVVSIVLGITLGGQGYHTYFFSVAILAFALALVFDLTGIRRRSRR